MQKLIFVSILFLLCACGEKDINYEGLKKGNYDERVEKFKSYPLSERFRLYNKIYKQSAQINRTWPSVCFNDKPEEAFNFILKEMKNNDPSEFDKYFPILYNIGYSDSFDICEMHKINSLREVIANYKWNEENLKILRNIHFKKCDLL